MLFKPWPVIWVSLVLLVVVVYMSLLLVILNKHFQLPLTPPHLSPAQDKKIYKIILKISTEEHDLNKQSNSGVLSRWKI